MKPPKPPNNVDVDAEVAAIARRYSVESVATLIAVCRDDAAPASAKTSAATKLLEYAAGRPGMAKTITRADMASLPDEAKRDLFDWLLLYFTGSGLEPLLQEVGLLAQPAKALPAHSIKRTKNAQLVPSTTSRFHFHRGPPKPPRPRHHPPGWDDPGYKRPSPAPAGPPEAQKADPASMTAPAAQAPVLPPQDARLTPTPSLMPRLGLAEHLPADLTVTTREPVRDAFGNIVPVPDLARMRPVGRS